MENKDLLLFAGTTFGLMDHTNGETNARKFMLVECFEEQKIFQVICIEGNKPGRIYGYIDEDPLAIKHKAKAISLRALIKNLDSIFIYEKSSLIISEEHSTSIDKL